MDPERNRYLKQAWPILAGLLIALSALVYGIREHSRARELGARQEIVTGSLGVLQKQVQDLSLKLTSLSEAQKQAEAARAKPEAVAVRRPSPAASPAQSRPAARRAAARPAPEDPRWKKMESQLSEHSEKIASTQEQMAKTRDELDGRLTSTKDELNTSIARTHEEVVALQKRGERDYHEFHISKSKDFRRVGPVSLSLRKADVKHKRYNIELIVDDIKLEKKNVNLYEPIYLSIADRPQPVELVANQVYRDHVQGYISVPKYKKSELTADAGTRGKLTAQGSPQ